MKSQFSSLMDFAQEIERRESSKADYLAPGKKMLFSADSRIGILGDEEHDMMKVTEYAEGQLSDRLGIPRRYYQRMKTAAPELLKENVDRWLPDQEKMLIRTLDGTVRAVLSNGYKPIDNWLVMQAFMPVLKEYGQEREVEIKATALSDTKMYMQVIFPGISREVVKGDIVQAGITLTNSEVGAGMVDVSTFVNRVVCSNGMIGTSLLSRRHVGTRMKQEDMDIYKDDTIMAEIKSYQLRLRDTIAAALSETEFEKLVYKFQKAEYDIMENPVETVENVTRKYSFSEAEKNKIMGNLIESGSRTRWALANSITAMAHDIESYDRAFDYEKTGHEIIELKTHEWEELTA